MPTAQELREAGTSMMTRDLLQLTRMHKEVAKESENEHVGVKIFLRFLQKKKIHGKPLLSELIKIFHTLRKIRVLRLRQAALFPGQRLSKADQDELEKRKQETEQEIDLFLRNLREGEENIREFANIQQGFIDKEEKLIQVIKEVDASLMERRQSTEKKSGLWERMFGAGRTSAQQLEREHREWRQEAKKIALGLQRIRPLLVDISEKYEALHGEIAQILRGIRRRILQGNAAEEVDFTFALQSIIKSEAAIINVLTSAEKEARTSVKLQEDLRAYNNQRFIRLVHELVNKKNLLRPPSRK